MGNFESIHILHRLAVKNFGAFGKITKNSSINITLRTCESLIYLKFISFSAQILITNYLLDQNFALHGITYGYAYVCA